MNYTDKTLKPFIVNLMFEDFKQDWIQNYFMLLADEIPLLNTNIYTIVADLVGVQFNMDEGDEFESIVNTERLGAIYERFKDFFLDHRTHWHGISESEKGAELKKALEEYVDWLFEMRDKQQAKAQ